MSEAIPPEQDSLPPPTPEGSQREVPASPRAATLTRPQQKLACLRRIAQAPQLDEAQRYLLANFVETYLQLGPEDTMAYATLLSEEVWRGEVEESEMTWGDRLQAKIIAEVRAKDGPEMEARFTEKLRQLLLLLLTQRFGPLSEVTRLRVQAITTHDDLQRLGERIFTAPSLADLDLV